MAGAFSLAGMSAKGKEDSDSGKRPELAEKPKGCPFVGRRVKRSSLESLFEDMFAGDELPDLVVQEHDNGELLCIDAKKPGSQYLLLLNDVELDNA